VKFEVCCVEATDLTPSTGLIRNVDKNFDWLV
jgi:hypothetical protein